MGLFSGAALGLWSAPNPFSAVPAGSLSLADNVYFSSEGVLEPRRGIGDWIGLGDDNAIFGNPGDVGDSLAFYGTTVLLAYGKTKVSAKPAGYFFTDFNASFVPPSDNRMRFMPAVRSMFFNTTNGLYDYDGIGQPYLAGNPPGLDIDATVNSANPWMDTDSAVAYRFTICSKDAFGRIIEGPPSGRTVVKNRLAVAPAALVHNAGTTVWASLVNGNQQPHYLNVGDILQLAPGEPTGTGGSNLGFPAGNITITSIVDPYSFSYDSGVAAAFGYYNTVEQEFQISRSVDLTLFFPTAPQGQPVTVNNFFRVYRSDMTFAAADVPTDDLFQCYESPYMTAADLARGYWEFQDTCPQNSLGAELYTSPNFATGGTLQANNAPPVDVDHVYFANRAWYANTTNKHSLQVALIGVGAPDGLQVGAGISIRVAGNPDVDFVCQATNPVLLTPVPTTFSSSPVGGSLTAQDYWYRIAANDGYHDTLASAEKVESVVFGGNTSSVTLNWSPVLGAVSYKIYGRTQGAELLLATVAAPLVTWIDDGSLTPAGALPIKNATGQQYFELFTDSDPGYNISRTAQSLVYSINHTDLNTHVYAYYVSDETGIPGQILLIAREFGSTHAFQLLQGSAYGSAWNPQLPDQFAPLWTPPTSDDNRHPAGLWYSRLGQPEAVPYINYLMVDSDNDPILRIFPLHYRLIVFKTTGIYSCTNIAPFTIQKLSDHHLVAPDSLAVLEDRLYALTDQGVIVVTDSGIDPVSDSINATLTQLGGPVSLPFLRTKTIGLAYRSARQYLLWMIGTYIDITGQVAYDTINTQAFVYSTLSKGWTRYTFGVNACIIDPTSDRVVAAPTADHRLWRERKELTLEDYHDQQWTSGAILSASGSSAVFQTVDAVRLTAGDTVTTGLGMFLIIDVDLATDSVTVLGTPGWSGGNTVDVQVGYTTSTRFNKLTNGSPALRKMVDQVSYLMRNNSVYETKANFSTEVNPIPIEVNLQNEVWGKFAWGELQYGCIPQQIRRVQPLPIDTSESAQLSVGFSTRQAHAKFEFLGIDVVAAPDTDKNRSP